MKTLINWLLIPLFQRQNCAYHRQSLFIAGEKAWALEKAVSLVDALPSHLSTCWLGEQTNIATTVSYNFSRYKEILGREYDIVFLSYLDGFRPSIFTAVAGTVKAGGTLVVLCPSLETWPTHASVTSPYFLSYGYALTQSTFISNFVSTLVSQQACGIVTDQSGYLPSHKIANPRPKSSLPFSTPDQLNAYETLIKHYQAGTPAIALLAKRGRGKSTLAGLVAADFINKNLKVAITSYTKHSADTLMATVNSVRPPQSKDGHPLLTWYAFDNPALFNDDIDVLFIEEAASLPIPVTLKLIHHAPFTLLLSTTDGYEGSGQGFRYRVIKGYDIPTITMTQPIRWYDGDPLEAIAERLLFLPKKTEDDQGCSQGSLTYHHGNASTIDEIHLFQIMDLLREAHYQTTPDDILRIIDSPNNGLFYLLQQNQVVAAAIVDDEGGEKLREVKEAIASGARRVKGHLTAQSLALMSTKGDFATLVTKRINRIAVRPEQQNNGLGSKLVEHIINLAQAEGADHLTVSFGTTPPLLAFWMKHQFKVLKEGKKQDKASGKTSSLLGLPFTPKAHELYGGLPEQQKNTNIAGHEQIHFTRLMQCANGMRSLSQLYSTPIWLAQHYPDSPLCAVMAQLGKGASVSHLAISNRFKSKAALMAWIKDELQQWLRQRKA
ncbi:GNAT family N-acetyltransferase [Alteromonas sp. 14N.309.X.WAT.G.H12]|uniref:GNAT family N-acetyltransferase n=1 Tax=Alteromonas sp. 14N.309.X.WAT.G.H12 TaxID=3120824 RepID=UPI002FD52531